MAKEENRDETKKILGLQQEFRVGQRVVDLYPIRLNDWPKFSEVVGLLKIDRLQEIFLYKDATDTLEKMFRIVTRREETDEIFFDITQKDYADFREKVMGQNDLDFNKPEESKDSKN